MPERDEPVDEAVNSSTSGRRVEELVAFCESAFDFGRSHDGHPYAVARTGGPAWKLADHSLRDHIASELFNETGSAVRPTTLDDALRLLEARARQQPPVPVFLRVGRCDRGIVLDLADEKGRAVLIEPGGRRVLRRSPVLFWRTVLTAPQRRPRRVGDLDRLRPLLNVADADWDLIVGWLVAAFFVEIPHPILVIRGQQGTGKSNAERMLRSLIDPSTAPTLSLPRGAADFASLASATYLLAFDNVSAISHALSDLLCKAVSGDAHVSRRLYTNFDVAVAAYRRLIILDGIDLPALRGDLADRIVPIELQPIPSDQRLLEADLRTRFEAVLPAALGGLLDLLATVLDVIDDVEVEDLPRMADFAVVLAAVDEVRGSEALSKYRAAIGELAVDVVESDTVAGAVLALTREEDFEGWEGTSSALSEILVPDPVPQDWPRTPRAMSARLKRAIPALRSLLVGVEMNGRRGHERRLIRITRLPDN